MEKLKDKFWHGIFKRPYRLHKAIDQGNGKQLIVLIHGIGVTSKTWLPLLSLLDDSKYRVIGYDLLGFGQSIKPKDADYSTSLHARSIAYSVKRDTGLRRSGIVLIGHSMGCIIASKIDHDDLLSIKQVILYQPPLLSPNSEKERRNLYKSFYTYLGDTPNLVIAYSKFLAKRKKGAANFFVDPDTWIAFERSMKNTILKQETLNELYSTDTPTDIIYGKMDFVVSRSQAKNLIDKNHNIMLHKVTESHDVSLRAGRYIKKTIKQ